MKQQGVTLIQMMFGLAMAALLTQLGMPAYAKLSDDLHRAAAARDLAQALRSARSHAALQGQAVVVQSLDNDWGKGWRVLLEHNQQLLREYRLARPQRVKANIGNQVKFSALGVPLGKSNNLSGGRLEVCERSSATSRHRVVLATSGRVSLRTDELKKSLCAGR
ncbi:GspH/FimT family protein [Pseudomonas sp. BR1R-5]|uniref:GspH/FimT family pseudopilin n=1 Tax=unclassified Pseudomonas TaxID=196821 RepID=UPI0018CAB38E|nr:GspH/FimT family protein [Pseudomonas sp. BR1R-5]MBM7397897.1 type IV fimbrial biogenesis protein FimT [Pseudomonas sp. M5]QPN44842.1 GspH/FimT family pseudopilin [Priestia aryabhattai]GLH35099.1 general secretion pathway protein GspH [Pseudomonas sp. BR1R-5]HDS1758221.1 GspH/FimT family pseudopilin [Pseudomonas putida]